MNFLAHIFLSGTDADILLGNFMADEIKGRDLSRFPEQVQVGIKLHRRIDHFTDTHPVSGKARGLLRGSMGKYAGVVLDVFYDHFLACKWQDFHTTKLEEYVDSTYEFLSSRSDEMPERTRNMFYYMKKNDWLNSYLYVDGIDRALQGLSSRVAKGAPLARSKVELLKYYDELSDNFDTYFPLLQQECHSFLEER